MSELEAICATQGRSTHKTSEGYVERLSRKLLLRKLENLRHGQLLLNYGNQAYKFGTAGSREHPRTTIEITDPRFFTSTVLGGSVGAAEAYIRGYWHCDDLTPLVQLLVRNRDVLDNMDGGVALLARPLRRLLHWANENTRSRSRRNIARHYDLGNDFFSLWLDESMMYSSAVYERADMSLNEASIAKIDRLCQKLELTADDHVLEIGTGWGGFAVHAATHYGCRVTTTTISREQYEYTRARVHEAGLQDRVNLLLEDYRDLGGQYDKLVSIEMIEAVGHKYLDTYFSQCARLLKPNGMMALQAITIADQRYKSALKSVDFIQKYIFPGGFLPSVTAIQNSVTAASDMRLYHLEDIGEHYARTLQTWRHNFDAQLQRIRSLGYAEEFLRMWEYYFCYCEGAFLERAIGSAQMLFIKPGCRRAPIVPALRQSSTAG